jgi:hypothetical protein
VLAEHPTDFSCQVFDSSPQAATFSRRRRESSGSGDTARRETLEGLVANPLLVSQLSYATVSWKFPNKVSLAMAISPLSNCVEHGGMHHFAVTGQGMTLWCSRSGVNCINNANLGFRLPVACNDGAGIEA